MMELAILLMAIGLHFTQLAQVSAQDCPPLFKRFSSNHSYCRPPNRACKIMAYSPTQDDIENIMNLHNSYRNSVATEKENLPAAANMLYMEWDEELAAVAQKYADQCVFQHDCSNCRRVGNFGVGQNMAIQKQMGSTTIPQPDWKSAVSAWFSEIIYFHVNKICNIKPNDAVGEYKHFTQLVWAETFRVGCGYVLYQEGNTSGERTYVALYICNYGPAGNTYGNCVYEAGPPCSKCPVNSCCGNSCGPGNKYQGLCRRIDNEAPYYPPPQNPFFFCDFSKHSDCNYYIIGSPKWLIESTLSGNYLGIVLNGGENSTIFFRNVLKPMAESFCISIKYRKGPNIEGDEESNTALEMISIQDYFLSQQLPSSDNPSRQEFSTYDMSLSWDMETELKISFAVPEKKPPQFFNIKSITATNGLCKAP